MTWASVVLSGCRSRRRQCWGETVRCFIWAWSQSFSSPLQSLITLKMTKGCVVGWRGNSLYHSPAISVGVHYTHRLATHMSTHTYTQSFICMQYPLWEIITHMQSEMWTLWGRCVHYSPHYKYDSVGIPCPTHQADSPAEFHPQGVGVHVGCGIKGWTWKLL